MALLKTLIYLLIVLFPVLELGKFNVVSSISVNINDVLVGLIFIVFIFLTIARKIKIKGRLFIPLLSFFIVALVSLLINILNYNLDEIFVSSLYLVRWISYASLYLVIINFSKKSKENVAKLLLIFGSIVLLIGLLQFIFYQNLGNLYYLQWDMHLYRLFGTFLDPNFAGAFYVLFTIYSLGFLMMEKNKRNKIYLSLISFFSIVAVVLTYSRSAIIMLVISTLVFLFLIKKIKYALIFILLLFVVILSSPRVFQTEGTDLFRSYSSGERLKNSAVAIEIFKKNPFIGVGFNTYRYAQYDYGFLSGDKWLVTHSGSGADNSFLFVLATTGVIGFVTYIFFLGNIFKVTINSLSKDDYKKNVWAIIFISSFCGLLFNSFFINSLFYSPIMLWMWMVLGITESN